MFKHGYRPIVKPNKERWRGYYRKKARKLYNHPVGKQKYRHRSRGESIFASLTNEFGDRLKSIKPNVSEIRIGCRVIAYQVKIVMRLIGNKLESIIAYVDFLDTFITMLSNLFSKNRIFHVCSSIDNYFLAGFGLFD